MKINQFNTTDASNVPRKLSLVNPFSRETIFDDDGRTLDFYIYGIQSDISRNALKARDRKYGKITKMTDDQATQSGAEFLAALTQGWSDNMEDDDGPIVYSGMESAVELYKKHDWIAKQINTFAMGIENYDPLRWSESGSTSGNSHGSTQRQKSTKKAD